MPQALKASGSQQGKQLYSRFSYYFFVLVLRASLKGKHIFKGSLLKNTEVQYLHWKLLAC